MFNLCQDLCYLLRYTAPYHNCTELTSLCQKDERYEPASSFNLSQVILSLSESPTPEASNDMITDAASSEAGEDAAKDLSDTAQKDAAKEASEEPETNGGGNKRSVR